MQNIQFVAKADLHLTICKLIIQEQKKIDCDSKIQTLTELMNPEDKNLTFCFVWLCYVMF